MAKAVSRNQPYGRFTVLVFPVSDSNRRNRRSVISSGSGYLEAEQGREQWFLYFHQHYCTNPSDNTVPLVQKVQADEWDLICGDPFLQ